MCYLIALSVMLNFPMLKGLCKALKYDCLSILFSVTGLLCYLPAKRRRSFGLFGLAIILAALAYAEKDAAISVIFFIAGAEAVFTYFQTDLLRGILLRLGKLGLIIPARFPSDRVGRYSQNVYPSRRITASSVQRGAVWGICRRRGNLALWVRDRSPSLRAPSCAAMDAKALPAFARGVGVRPRDAFFLIRDPLSEERHQLGLF
jgi:hypothetical protein